MAHPRNQNFRRVLNEEIAETLIGPLKNSSVSTLNLEYYHIIRSGADVMIYGLENTKISHLSIQSCRIDKESLHAIVRGLKYTEITELDLHFEDDDVRNLKLWPVLSDWLKGSKVIHLKVTLPTAQYEDMRLLANCLQLNRITNLDLSNCKSGDVRIIQLARGLEGSNVEQVRLRSNCIRGDAAKILIKSLVKTKITYLDLSDNDIGEIGAKSFGKHLKHTQLEQLSLTDNFINSRGIQALAKDIRKTKITQLFLLGNHIPYNFCDSIIGSNIMVIDVGFNLNVRPSVGDNCWESALKFMSLGINLNLETNSVLGLAKALNKTELRRVNFSNNRIDKIGAMALAQGLRYSKVTHLNLSCNKIGIEGLTALANSLRDSKITCLNLKCCEIGNEGVTVIGGALRFSKITDLSLEFNGIGSEGVEILSENLKNTSVLYVNLNGNYLETRGAKSLAKCLKYTNLLRLDLISSKIGAKGIQLIIDGSKNSQITHLALGFNSKTGCSNLSLKGTKIKCLDLSNNNIKNRAIKNLAESFRNTQLSMVDLGLNPIRFDGLLYLISSLKYTEITHIVISKFLIAPGEIEMLSDEIKNTQLISLIFDFGTLGNRIHQPGFRVNFPRLNPAERFQPFYEIKDGKWQLRKALYRNWINANRIVEIFKNVVVQAGGVLSFSLESDPDNQFDQIIDLMRFLQDTPGMVSHLVNDEYATHSREQIVKFVRYVNDHFAEFVARSEPDSDTAVNILQKCEKAGLREAVISLLYHRPLFWIGDGILHPYVYKTLLKYGFPLYNLQIEPDAKDKIIYWCATNMEYEQAVQTIDLFRLVPYSYELEK